MKEYTKAASEQGWGKRAGCEGTIFIKGFSACACSSGNAWDLSAGDDVALGARSLKAGWGAPDSGVWVVFGLQHSSLLFIKEGE